MNWFLFPMAFLFLSIVNDTFLNFNVAFLDDMLRSNDAVHETKHRPHPHLSNVSLPPTLSRYIGNFFYIDVNNVFKK